ncbi:MAG: Smr/MutS family protein [Holophagaceae bacterium]|nr:Smr/MutS family protein [Holophagaceae bacterium]
MHLAAGMAVEVDGTLDLRRHSLNDAKERLKERIRDGMALRWRTLLVVLGPNEALKQGFLAFLTTPQAQFISRYAQAPIPMGGAQAWVLYLGQPAQLETRSKEEA